MRKQVEILPRDCFNINSEYRVQRAGSRVQRTEDRVQSTSLLELCKYKRLRRFSLAIMIVW